MKYIRMTFYLILIVSIFSTNINAQEVGKYVYPLNPKMPEWKSLPVAEKNKMLQIPNDILTTMPTDVLIQAYIDNPFCSLLFAYNITQDGFHRIYKEFNGLRELMNRNDAALKIIEFYNNMQVDGFDENWLPSEKGEFTFKFIYIEVLFSQPEIISQLSINNLKVSVNNLIKKYNKKTEYINEHSILGLESCTYAIAHLLNNNGALYTSNTLLNKNIQSFLATGRFTQDDVMNTILQKATIFLQNN